MKKLTALILALLLVFTLSFATVYANNSNVAVDDPGPDSIKKPVIVAVDDPGPDSIKKPVIVAVDDPGPDSWEPPVELI